GTGNARFGAAQYASGRVLVVSLGGDDVYEMPLAGVAGVGVLGVPLPNGKDLMTSVAVDLGGNDVYAPQREWTLGAANGTSTSPTFAMLFDAGGNDIYRGTRHSLGTGEDGFGILVDAGGDDRY